MNGEQYLMTKPRIAVIGVTENQDKYGFKIFKRLLDLDYEVYGISPIYKEVLGQTLYPSLLEINNEIDLVIFVVSPKYGKDYLNQVITKKIRNVWFQPGTFDDSFSTIIKENNIQYFRDCVLLCTPC